MLTSSHEQMICLRILLERFWNISIFLLGIQQIQPHSNIYSIQFVPVIVPGNVAGVHSASKASCVRIVGMAPAQDRCGRTRETDPIPTPLGLEPSPCGLRWLLEDCPGLAGDGRGIPGDPGQVLGAGEVILWDGNGLCSMWVIPAGLGEGVGNIPAGLGACSGLRGELAIPKALPGPGDGCGNMDGDGLITPEGNEGGEANEKEDVAGLEPKAPCCVCCCWEIESASLVKDSSEFYSCG